MKKNDYLQQDTLAPHKKQLRNVSNALLNHFLPDYTKTDFLYEHKIGSLIQTHGQLSVVFATVLLPELFPLSFLCNVFPQCPLFSICYFEKIITLLLVFVKFRHTFSIYMIDIIKYYSLDKFPAIIALLPAKML